MNKKSISALFLLTVLTTLTVLPGFAKASDCDGTEGVAQVIGKVIESQKISNSMCLVRLNIDVFNQHFACPMQDVPKENDWIVALDLGCPSKDDTASGILKLYGQKGYWELSR